MQEGNCSSSLKHKKKKKLYMRILCRINFDFFANYLVLIIKMIESRNAFNYVTDKRRINTRCISFAVDNFLAYDTK